MEAVKAVLEYYQLFEKYPFLAWNIPFLQLTIWQGMTKFFVYACIYRFFRWFWLTGWLLKLIEVLAGYIFTLAITICTRVISGFWQLLTKVLALLINEMLKYRITKILLIGGSAYVFVRLIFVIKTLFNQ